MSENPTKKETFDYERETFVLWSDGRITDTDFCETENKYDSVEDFVAACQDANGAENLSWFY